MVSRFFIALGLLVLAIGYLVFVGFEIDSVYINQKIKRELSDSLGREVSVEGPVLVNVSMMPSVSVHGLHIANPKSFSSSAKNFMSLNEAHLSLNLWGLFRNQLTIERISGEGLTIAMIEQEDGSNNWSFKSSPEDPEGLANILELLERSAINKIDFKNFNLSYQHANQQARHFNLDLIEASIPSRKNIKIAVRGKVEKSFPYHGVVTADSLTNLASAIKTISADGHSPANEEHEKLSWNFKAELNFLNSRSHFIGKIQDKTARLSIDLLTPNLEKFGKILDVNLPNIGQTKVKSSLVYSEDLIQMKNFKATFDNAEVNGDFNLALTKVPNLTGKIYLPTLDITPFLKGSSQKNDEGLVEENPKSFVNVYKQLLANDFDLAMLNLLNAEVDLKLDQLIGMPTDINNGQLTVKLVDGELVVPMQLVMAGVNVKGQLDAHASKNKGHKTSLPKSSAIVKLHLWASDQEIADLGQALTGVPGLKGHLGSLDIAMSAQGKKLGDAFEHLTLKTTLENSHLSYGNAEGASPVDFTVRRLNFVVEPHQPLLSSFAGTLLNQAITIDVTGSALSDIVKSGQAQYQLNAQSKSVMISMLATSSMLSETPHFDLKFKVNSADSTDLANWFGLRTKYAKPFTLAGDFHADEKKWSLEHLILSLGQSDFGLDVQNIQGNKKSPMVINFSSHHLDYDELKSILPEPAQTVAKSKSSPDSFSLNVPILPKGVDLADANINIALKHIVGMPMAIQNVAFKIKINDGFISTSPFSFDLDQMQHHGAIYLDLRSSDPVVKLWFTSHQANIGNILKQLKISQKIDASFDQLSLYIESHSALLGDLIGQATVLGELSAGIIRVEEPQTKKTIIIKIDQGSITASPQAKLALKLAGTVNDSPINIQVEAGKLKTLMDFNKRLPFSLNARVAKTELDLAASLSRKIEEADLDLQLKVSGEKLSDLNHLLNIDAPPWGPWHLSGMLKASNTSYDINNFDLQVGSSALSGRGSLLTGFKPIKLNVKLNAHQIQLDDFSMNSWAKPKDATAISSNSDAHKVMSKEALSQKVEQFLSPALLSSANVDFSAKVDQVVSGEDTLGRGGLDFVLQNGQATIGPISVDTNKGSAIGWLKYKPRDKNIQLDFHADVNRFDYGIIARRFQPKSDIKGQFNLKVDVSSQAPHLSDLWKYADGHLDFAVFPENQKAGVFDLWAVNILTGLLPVVDPAKESKVNCAIGKLQLENGTVREKVLQIDTTKMRVTGVLYADLKTQQVFAKVRPQAKEAQFFSLATPIEVNGTFDKFKIGPSVADVAETVLRIGTSIVVVPLKKLFGEKMQMDGADICTVF